MPRRRSRAARTRSPRCSRRRPRRPPRPAAGALDAGLRRATARSTAMPAIGSASQSIRNYGGAFGVDRLVAPDLLLGFSAGGSEANVSVPTAGDHRPGHRGHLGVYGVKTWGATTARPSATPGFDNSTTRTIAGIGPTEIATGHFASDQLSGRFEVGWKHAFAGLTLTPFVAIEPAALWAHGYTETSATAGGGAGILGLSFAAHHDLVADVPRRAGRHPHRCSATARCSRPTRGCRGCMSSCPTARSPRPSSASRPRRSRSMARAPRATPRGSTPARNTRSTPTRSLFANLTGEWSDASTSYAATAGFKWR